MLIGYARVSTKEQDTQLQIASLQNAGCEKIFEEKISGGRWERPQMKEMLSYLRPGDTLIVWKLDRLSRSLKDLLFLIEELDRKKVGFKSITEPIDTTTPSGKMFIQMIGVFAEFERNLLRERTIKGLEEARKIGRIGGRKPKLNKEQKSEIKNLYLTNGKPISQIAKLFNVHPSTIYRLMQNENI